MEKINTKPGAQKASSQKAETSEPIKTDYPLSEKDEVKQAEEKMRRAAKKLL
jgi:hypothetical protein